MIAVQQAAGSPHVQAATQTQSGAVGLQGTIPSPAPTQAATVSTPSNGQTFTSNPITVSGLCPKGLLVKVFANNVLVGSLQCTSGSYSIQVDLFSGRNDIVVRVYDALDQAGPDSPTVSVTFTSGQFAGFGAQLTLTSPYAERGADPGQELDWPIVLSGGLGPYAISVDWGDSTSPELISASFAGTITMSHTYAAAGIYTVIVRATDKNGQVAFLQLVGIADGAVAQKSSSNGSASTNNAGQSGALGAKTGLPVWAAVSFMPLAGISFWLGQRYKLSSLRRQLEHSREQ